MATYGGAVDLVLTELGRGDTSITAVIEREVLKAIEHYAPTRFWFNEARVSFTASNTIYYPLANLSSPLFEIDQAVVTVNGSVIEMRRESHQELNRRDVSGFTGYPTHYAIWSEKIRIYTKPASGTTYQVDVDGTVRLATLSASTDSNAWTLEGLDLIAARAARQVCAKRFKDFDAAQTFKLVEDDELQRLLDRTTALGFTGRIRPGW